MKLKCFRCGYWDGEACRCEDRQTLFCGDSREIIPHLPKIDLVVTDPPYGVDFKGKNSKHKAADGIGYDSIDDNLKIGPEVVRMCLEICDRAIITPGSAAIRDYVYPNPKEIGCVYFSQGGGMSSWGFRMMYMMFYYGSDPRLAKGLGLTADSFHPGGSMPAGETYGHPCPKPVKWMKWMINKGSIDENDVILDPFAGSAATLQACKEIGRKGIGIELSKMYCNGAVKRLKKPFRPTFKLTQIPKKKLPTLGFKKKKKPVKKK